MLSEGAASIQFEAVLSSIVRHPLDFDESRWFQPMC